MNNPNNISTGGSWGPSAQQGKIRSCGHISERAWPRRVVRPSDKPGDDPTYETVCEACCKAGPRVVAEEA